MMAILLVETTGAIIIELGTDANHDGIGDTPYIVDANNIDNYPLMIQYIIPEFPSNLILPLFFIATLVVVIVHRRKHVKS
jgi:hypothetical protein